MDESEEAKDTECSKRQEERDVRNEFRIEESQDRGQREDDECSIHGIKA